MNNSLLPLAVWALDGLRPAILWTAAAVLIASPFAAMLLAPICGLTARHNPHPSRKATHHGRS